MEALTSIGAALDLTSKVKAIVKNLEKGVRVTLEEIESGYFDTDYQPGDIISAFDYLADFLDIEYIVNGKSDYLGANVVVTYGGPNIWINTRKRTVEGAWGSDTVSMAYHDDVMGLDGTLEELWASR